MVLRYEVDDVGQPITYDEVGDPDGVPVLYLHGTPDSRLARHPDDEIAARCGVRLFAVDRAGFGGTAPRRSRGAVGWDFDQLLEEVGALPVALLGWSSGGLDALATAYLLGGHCSSVTLVGSVPPVEAYDDPVVMAALGAGRRSFVEMARGGDPQEVAAEVAPHLVPLPLDPALARAHVLETAGELGASELEAVPGAVDRMVEALLVGVEQGVTGIEIDLAQQLRPGLDVGDLGLPVHTIHGELDPISPPAVGEWLVRHIPGATLEVVPGAGHHLLFPHWERLLRNLVERQRSR